MVASFIWQSAVRPRRLWRVLTWPARVSAARRTMSELARMSEYELRDIGLTRSDVNDATALPLDADPSGLLVRRRAWRERSVRRTNLATYRGLTRRGMRRPSTKAAKRSRTCVLGPSNAFAEPLMTAHSAVAGVEINAKPSGRQDEILSAEALAFIAGLHRRFNRRRLELLARRMGRQEDFDAGKLPDFLAETKAIRDGDWTVAKIPADLLDRRVEITGPVDRKMIVNALNSGAKVFMADFEDATSPVFANMVEGQANLKDRWAGKIDFTDPASGKSYALKSRSRRADGAAARLAFARAPCRRRRRGNVRLAVRLRPLRLPLRQGPDRQGRDAGLLPAQAREPSRSAGSGTTSSPTRSASLACRMGRSRRPC